MSTPSAAPRREPIFNLPRIIVLTIAVLVGVHACREVLLSDESEIRLLLECALVPARWALALDPSRADAILQEASDTGPAAALARYVVADADPKWWSAVTYAGLHGSWTHVLLNSVWLAAFGTPVARRCGAARCLGLGLVGVLGGALAHVLVHPLSVLPLIGASAGVSGLMAAASRFVFVREQHDGSEAGPAGTPPAQGLAEVLTNRRAALFIAVWFATNILFGLLATPLGVVDASIAWEAHMGGFVAGFLLFPWFERRGSSAAVGLP